MDRLLDTAGNDDRRYEHDRVGLSPRKPDLLACCDGRMVGCLSLCDQARRRLSRQLSKIEESGPTPEREASSRARAVAAGYDNLASMLDQIADVDNEATTYPPYNIERLTENEYRITMAVAGFGKEDVEIEVNENTLSIRGKKKAADTERTFLHRGLRIPRLRAPLPARRLCRGEGG